MIVAHQPGSKPIENPETIPNPLHEPVPVKVPATPKRQPAKRPEPGHAKLPLRGGFFYASIFL